MSELQLALLAIGAVVIVAVVVYNKWQESQYRKSAEHSFALKHEDALLESESLRARGSGTAGQVSTDPEGLRREPFLADAAPKVRGTEPGSRDGMEQSNDGGSRSAIDFAVCLESEHAIGSTRLIEVAVLELAKFSKPVRLEGMNAENGSWTAVGHGGSFSSVRAGIQLVNREGRISAEELARFEAAVGRMATALVAKAIPSTQAEALDRAADLDRFCGDVDVQIAFNVVAAAYPFQGARLLALADSASLVLEDDGKFYRRDVAGRVLFTMAGAQGRPLRRNTMNELVIPAVTLELDVPRTQADLEAFDALQALAEQISETLGGKIADDNQVTIETAARQAIRTQLEKIYSEMADFGIPAGSGVAFRLFS